MAAISDLIVCNMALSHIGAASIASLSEDTAEANACNRWYDWSRLQTLQAIDWNFARKRKRLVLYAHPYPDLNEWAYRYIYPSDAVRIRHLINPLGHTADAIPFEVEEADLDVVTNGDFTRDLWWTKGTGWTIAAQKATAATASSDLEQTIETELTEGEAYTLTFTLTYTSGSVTPKVGGTSGTARSSSGTFSEDITAGSTDLLEFTGSSLVGSIDAVSLSPAAGKAVLSDLDEAIAAYTVDHSTLSRWSPLAIEAFSFALANKIAFTITSKKSVGDTMRQEFYRSLRIAAADNGNEEIQKLPRDADWIRGRA